MTFAYNPSDNDITYFAKTTFRNREQVFGIRRDDRRRHMYVLGKTGTGKSTLLENLALSDIKNGEGVAYFDPHGESVERLLDFIPSYRVNDVVYFNPHDTEYPIGFNILEIKDPSQKHLVASGLMAVFTKLWANVWSARMEYILNNTVLALLDTPGQTMLGIPRMYSDKKFRNKIIANIKDPVVKNFWEGEYANYNEKYRTEAIAPIQNKVGQFLSSSIIRNIVAQPKSTIDFRDIMDNRKILLVNLSKGRIGEDSSSLLGAMMITKLQLAAMSRVDMPESKRQDFYLYVDEFQNFATEAFATILSEARKYKLNLIVAHQYIAQLYDQKTRAAPVKDAIFGNVGTIIIFRTGADDAEFLEKEFEPIFELNDLVNLAKYHIYLKLMINGVASSPFSAVTLPPIGEPTGNRDKVINVSRERYTSKREIVEKRIAKWLNVEHFAEMGKSADLAEDEEEEFVHPEKEEKTAEPSAKEPSQDKTIAAQTKKEKEPRQQRSANKNKKSEDFEKQKNASEHHNEKPSKKTGDKVWEEVTNIHEEKVKHSAESLANRLAQAIENYDIIPKEAEKQTKADTRKKDENKTKKAMPVPQTKPKPESRTEQEDKKHPSSQQLKPGQRIKFE